MGKGLTISVTVTPTLQRLGNAFKDIEVKSILQDQIKTMAFTIERMAKQLTPVDTGRLRASIATDTVGLGVGARISTNTDYAIFVHEGTRYMAGRPFMQKGVELAKGEIASGVSKRIDKEFAKKFKSL